MNIHQAVAEELRSMIPGQGLSPERRRAVVAWCEAKLRRVERNASAIDAVLLQKAMKEAHGRRITTTETYAEAIARNYNRLAVDE